MRFAKAFLLISVISVGFCFSEVRSALALFREDLSLEEARELVIQEREKNKLEWERRERQKQKQKQKKEREQKARRQQQREQTLEYRRTVAAKQEQISSVSGLIQKIISKPVQKLFVGIILLGLALVIAVASKIARK